MTPMRDRTAWLQGGEAVCLQSPTLVQRPDDRPEAVRVRLKAYAADTTPVAVHYRAHGLLMPLDAAGEPDDIFAQTLDGLAAWVLPP